MRSCRNEWRYPLAAALLGAGSLAFALAHGAPAMAQASAPVRLLPSSPGTAPTIPDNPSPPAPVPAPSDEPITATPLAPVDPAWIGAPGETAPLPQTMWAGTSRALVRAALPLLGPTTSPTLQALSRRLLASDAAAPAGQDAPDQPGLAALRIERMAALGAVDEALGVIAALPATLRSEALDRSRVELTFARNETENACRQVQDNIGRYQGLWWDRALIACQALTGDRAKAGLGLDLLREQKVPPDPGFDALIGAVGVRPAKLEKLPQPTPMLMTLLAAAKLPLAADTLASADLPSLRAWAGNETVPPLQRLPAAERATALGAMPPAALAELYGKVVFKPEELGAAIKQGKAPTIPRERALLFQVARTDPAAGVRAAALEALLVEAKKRNAFIAMARAVAPILVELPASPDLAGFAPNAIRALYAAERPDVAASWQGFVDPPTAPTLPLLQRIAQGESGPARDATALGAELLALSKREPAQAAMAAAALSAIDDPVMQGQPIILGEAYAVKAPNVTLTIDLQRAGAGKRIGETVLMALLVARGDDYLTAEPQALLEAVTGLRAIGLYAEGRALAREAALDAGL